MYLLLFVYIYNPFIILLNICTVLFHFFYAHAHFFLLRTCGIQDMRNNNNPLNEFFYVAYHLNDKG